MTVGGSFNNSSSVSSNSSISGLSASADLIPWYIVAGVSVAVTCLLGIPANIAIIVKLSRHLRGSSISRRLFFNLAVSDLLCLLCLPVGVFIFSHEPSLIHEVCQLIFSIFFFCITSDLNILVLISIQRYYQVLHPNKWEQVRRRWQRVLLSSVWLFAALLAVPAAFSLADVKNGEELANSCKYKRITPVLEVAYISFIIFSHIVLLSFYVLLVRGVKKNRMPDMKNFRVNQVFIKIIAISLIVGVLPLTLRVLYVTARLTGSEQLLKLSKKFTFVECFYFFNHCLNPFLYFFASRHQRSKVARPEILCNCKL